MLAYLDLLRQIMDEGELVQTRAYLPSEDRKPKAKTLFAAQFRHNLLDGFPAVTTKKLYFDSVVKELLWFLRGETNVATLGCNIWNGWPGKEDGLPAGECGPIYGAMWRYWPYATEKGTPLWWSSHFNNEECEELDFDRWDQIGNIVKDLQAVASDQGHSARRRIILNSWNPPMVPLQGLPPCHTLAQFLPTNGRLNVHCFWRSIDAFTGMPFNIASYALLTHILAAICGYEVGTLCASVTDLHLYDNQFDAVEEQLSRTPYRHPHLIMSRAVPQFAPGLTIKQCRDLTPEFFSLIDYKCHSPLKCEVAI